MQDGERRNITQAQSIQEATALEMASDESIVLIGEGVPDPKGIFGTTLGLRPPFGPDRVFDMPLSENGITGICIGAALSGLRPMLVHQRVDFALLTMDQLINNAAKWHYMFGDQQSVPMVVRLIIGRGWGQGPQHSQSLQSIFGHVPGLKVVMPVFPKDAKGLLISALRDPNPVIYIEHRWLHPLIGHVPPESYEVALDKAEVIREGGDVTIAALSHMVIEAIKVSEEMVKWGVGVEVINLKCVSSIDIDTVLASVGKTGRLIVAEPGHLAMGVSAEVIAQTVDKGYDLLVTAPERIACPAYPVTSAPSSAADYYPDAEYLAQAVIRQIGSRSNIESSIILKNLRREEPRDVPDPDYKGPF